MTQALGHAAVRHGHDVLFTTQTQLLRTLRQAEAVGTYERRFQALARLLLLIIDDFGLKPLRTPDDELLHDLFAERYERAFTILTSYLDFGEWETPSLATRSWALPRSTACVTAPIGSSSTARAIARPGPCPSSPNQPLKKEEKTAILEARSSPIQATTPGSITPKMPSSFTPAIDRCGAFMCHARRKINNEVRKVLQPVLPLA